MAGGKAADCLRQVFVPDGADSDHLDEWYTLHRCALETALRSVHLPGEHESQLIDHKFDQCAPPGASEAVRSKSRLTTCSCIRDLRIRATPGRGQPDRPWVLSVNAVSPDGAETVLWSGEKWGGDTRAGAYTRKSGLAHGPRVRELVRWEAGV